MKKILIMLSFIMGIIFNNYADDLSDAKQVIQDTVDKVITVLRDPTFDKQTKRSNIMELINPVFDFDLMAKLTLGRDHWSKFQGENKATFTDLFVRQLKNSYLSKAELFSDEVIEYDAPENTASGKVSINTRIIRKDGPIKMLYKLYKKDGSWKIYDLEIQEISIIKSYGSQYDQILKEHDVDYLLKELKDKVFTIESDSNSK
ncbi:MAG: hypothetical protein ACD_79C01153G0002 [uncultured bacterium]|nr:MAG: hypothetical protein ACD_79C01153G0002 [uncultured bacterium]